MDLIKITNDKPDEIVFSGTFSEIVTEIKKRNLCDWYDVFFYKRGHFEKMGLNDEMVWEYYKIK